MTEILRCKHRQDIKHHRNCFNSDGTLKEPKQYDNVKILSIDIETLPILGYSWGVWNQNIYSEQVKKDWCLLSYSAKWINNPNIISNVLTPKESIIRNDYRLSKEIWNLLELADVVIGFNSKRFDIKKINTRFLKNGLHKPSSYKHIDLITTAKSVFGLTYNKLDFIAKFLDLQRKLDTDFNLWEKCDEGDLNSLQKMRKYNEQDVIVQEEVYYALREWIPSHPDLSVLSKSENVCPICLSKNYKEIGLYTANTRQYPEFRCKACNSVWHSVDSV